MNNAGIDVAGEPATQSVVVEKTRHPSLQKGQTSRGKLVLLVEDDEGDQLLTREALAETNSLLDAVMVSDGDEALDYLWRKGKYGDAAHPDLIVVDLNMPKVNGQRLSEIVKQDPALQTIPIVVLSTSDYEEDVAKCYQAGVNSYVHKPPDFDEFVAAIGAIEHYWFHVVEPPPRG